MTNVAVHCTLCHCCGCWSLECCLYRTLDGQNGMENSEERLESLACIMNPTVLQSNWSMNEKFSKFMRLCSALHNIFIFYKYLRGLTGSPAADLALVVGFLFAFCHCFNNSHLQRIDLRKKCWFYFVSLVASHFWARVALRGVSECVLMILDRIVTYLQEKLNIAANSPNICCRNIRY